MRNVNCCHLRGKSIKVKGKWGKFARKRKKERGKITKTNRNLKNEKCVKNKGIKGAS
jgi:hypothetical protein